MKLTADLITKPEIMRARISEACDLMESIYDDGFYPKMIVNRSWSTYNPTIEGEFARPRAYRWYLMRELAKVLSQGAEIEIVGDRKIRVLWDPGLLDAVDEEGWDFTQKKLFLFAPERIDLSLNRLEHYTGTKAEDFQRYVLFTNYTMHVDVFQSRFPNCVRPTHGGFQMPAYHHKLPDNSGISLVNIGVGPANAKTCSDHIAVLRPDAMIMVGHCGGLRNHQEIGDFVLASGYMRADHVLDNLMPTSVPITPNVILNQSLQSVLQEMGLTFRIGTVYTTDNRNWEFAKQHSVREIHISRSMAVDMESATIATNGFRYRIPNATLLCVSDKPLHGKPKLSDMAQHFYNNSKERHLEVVLEVINRLKLNYPEGLPNASIRGLDEPLMGGL
jgi:AMP nucleosidase